MVARPDAGLYRPLSAVVGEDAASPGRRHLPAATFDAVSLRTLGHPVLLMNLPLSLSAEVPNNALMEALQGEEGEIDRALALRQFLALYRQLSRHALIYLLPSRPGLQDQAYVANLAAVLHHLEREAVVVSRFRSPPRVGEATVGFDFFRLMNFEVHEPPARFCGEELFFEGEADLKHLRDNLYIGAHGLRSSQSALRWLSESFGMEIIPFPIRDPRLFHLDCCLLPLDRDSLVVCTEVAATPALRAIEACCEVISLSLDEGLTGLTKSLVPGRTLFCYTTIATIRKDDPWYAYETLKIRTAERICRDRGLELETVRISEFYKSGAALSCLIARLNKTG